MRIDNRRFALLLMAPAALFLLLFIGYPLLRLFYDSLFDVNLLAPAQRSFVGFQNYLDAITSERVQGAALRTVQYTLIALVFEFVLGFGIALIFDAFKRSSDWARAVFVFPLMIPPVVAGLLWRFLLIDDFGIVNELLFRVGLLSSPDDIAWLSNTSLVLFSVAIPDIWLTTSFVALVVYAGLQTLPGDVLEAARVDGAGPWNAFWRVKVPLLRPVIAVVLIIRGIDAARAFDVILIQTGGGPQFASEVLSLHIYREMIRYGSLGYSSAIATLFLLGMVTVAIVGFLTIWRPGHLD
jgi:multiple sugar transport system permease protein